MNEQQNKPKRRKAGCIFALSAIPILLALVAGVFIALSLRMPYDAPLARMYRAETEVRALAKAVDTYYGMYKEYPPAGKEGLQMATRFLSARANYFPKGPPPDPWGHSYRYAPGNAYETPSSEALRSPDGFHAPGAYQVYSEGADGKSGFDGRGGEEDNITSWDQAKSWRGAYKELNRQFMKGR